MTIRDSAEVRSPCISVCKMNPVLGNADERAIGGLCVGCMRTIDEIIEWANVDDERRRVIVATARLRRQR